VKYERTAIIQCGCVSFFFEICDDLLDLSLSKRCSLEQLMMQDSSYLFRLLLFFFAGGGDFFDDNDDDDFLVPR